MNLHPGAIRALVSGLDLVCDAAGEWKILEDNLRIPSGIGYAMADRRVVRSVLPELQAPNGVLDADEGPALLREALLACAPPAAGARPDPRRGHRGPDRLGALRAPHARRGDGRAAAHALASSAPPPG